MKVINKNLDHLTVKKQAINNGTIHYKDYATIEKTNNYSIH